MSGGKLSWGSSGIAKKQMLQRTDLTRGEVEHKGGRGADGGGEEEGGSWEGFRGRQV